MRETGKATLPAALGALFCALAVVGLMLVVYHLPEPQRLDATALHGFITLEDGFFGKVAIAVVVVGGIVPLGLLLIPLYVWGGRWGRRPETIAAIAVVVLANLTTETMKIVFAHPRFQPVLGIHQVNAASFPSGHATSAMSMAVATLLVVPPALRRPAAIVGAILVFAVSFSVLVLAWHFPSDVLGGLLVATGYGFAAVWTLRRRRAAARRPAPALTLGVRLSRRAREAVGLALCGAAAVAVVLAPRILSYTDTYTTTVVVALAISSTAAVLLALFTRVASERA
jgi:membrane-associated phospholipid phosphatase